MSLKYTGELWIINMKNDAKIEEEFLGQFNIGIRSLMNFDLSTRKSQKLVL